MALRCLRELPLRTDPLQLDHARVTCRSACLLAARARRIRQRAPAEDEEHPADRSDCAEPSLAGQHEDGQAAGKEQGAQQKKPPGDGPRPPGFRLTPRAVVTFVMGSRGEKLKGPKGTQPTEITEKFVGDRAIVERSVVTLAGERGLLLVGEPGTAKSMLSELLSAAISGTERRPLDVGWSRSVKPG